MKRFATLLLFLAGTPLLHAQDITWITDCADKEFCFNQGSCSEGDVFIVEKAVTSCGSSSIVNYSYKIDLFNDGSLDIQSAEDTISATFQVGTHKVTWRATDNCGNLAQCTYLFTIKDCQPPNLICINSLSRNVDVDCSATIDASDFIATAIDNCTPTDELQIGLRRVGSGDGFPNQTSLVFNGCDDLGANAVEIWVKDENNLSSKCNGTIEIDDVSDVCGCDFDSNIGLEGCAHTADSTKLFIYTVHAALTATPPQGAPYSLHIQKNVEDSCYNAVFSAVPIGHDCQVVVRATRTGGWLDGVSTFDLLQTSKHILNIQPFQTVWQRLATDVNASNSVTTFDIVETRKLILGIYDTFPAVTSWRFFRPVDDPSNLLSAVKDTYQIVLNNLSNDTVFKNLDFVGVKMGDANLSAMLTTGGLDDRSGEQPLLLTTDDRFLAAGETATIPLQLAEKATLGGWQLALSVNPALATIEGVEGLSAEDFVVLGNEVRALWFDAGGKSYSPESPIFFLKIKALQPVRLSQILFLPNEKLRAEAYFAAENSLEQRRPMLLRFDGNAANGTQFFPPRPNPFADETAFNLLLHKPGDARLEVFDLSGKQVFLKNMEMETGQQSYVLRAADLPSSGVFVYRIQVNGEVFSGRLVHK